jgi:nicotinamidase-related amidase
MVIGASNKQGEQADESNIALLIIDVQQGLFRKSTPIYKAEQLLENINNLVERAHRGGVPVFYIQHSDGKNLVMGSPQWQLHPRLQPLPPDYIVHKLHGNAFEDTNLDETLRSKHITSLVITGLVTHGCVRATCIGALKLGYRVILVTDAHSNYSKQAAKLIEDWNQKLSAIKVELQSTSEIGFSGMTSENMA